MFEVVNVTSGAWFVECVITSSVSWYCQHLQCYSLYYRSYLVYPLTSWFL